MHSRKASWAFSGEGGGGVGRVDELAELVPYGQELDKFTHLGPVDLNDLCGHCCHHVGLEN